MKRFEHKWSNFTWVDCEAPESPDLQSLSQEFNIPVHYLTNAMDPEHLVRLEFFDNKCFMILRLYDQTADSTAGTIQELTTKLVFFVGSDFVLTLHRAHIDFVERTKDRASAAPMTCKELLRHLCTETLMSFDHPMTAIESKTDVIEDRIYALKRKNILRKGYVIKRRASAFKKVLKFSIDVLQKLQTRPDLLWEDFQDLKDYNDRMIFYADDVLENITGLMNLHISLMSQKTNEASFRTNEVMRVLTLVSIFFLPLNFIAGIYGMNFKHMPELETQNGYYYTLGFMGLIAIGIALWIYRKRWVTKEDFQSLPPLKAPKEKKAVPVTEVRN